jgi:hypothetical protein
MTCARKTHALLSPLILSPLKLCETRAGNLAHAIGRIFFREGRPMLVEHVGGLYLEHKLTGEVVTPGYGDAYNIVHVFDEGCADLCGACSF